MCARAEISRRSLLAGGGAAGASLRPGSPRRGVPRDMVPLIGPGYRPTDTDEMGIWQLMERAEEEISGSNLLIKDPQLGFLSARHHRHRRRARRARTCASIWRTSRLQRDDVPDRLRGHLLRACSCACATRPSSPGVIAHEIRALPAAAHDPIMARPKRKSDLFAIGAMVAGVAGAAAGVYLGDYVQLAQLGTILSLFAYSRAMEAEADAMGARLIAEAGYPAGRDGERLGAADRRGRRQRPLSPQARAAAACSTRTRRPIPAWPT